MNGYNVTPVKQLARPQAAAPLIDFKQLWTLLVIKWYWVVASVIVCLLIAGLYLWFTPTTLTIKGKMELVDKSKKGSSGMSAGLAMLSSLPMGLGSSLGGGAGAGSIEAEKEIILSNSLVSNVVKDINLYTEYRLSKWGRKTLLYQNNPIEVSLDDAHVVWLDNELPLYSHQIKLIISKDNDGYIVEPTLIEGKKYVNLPKQNFVQLPALIKTEYGTLAIKKKSLPERQAKDFEDNYTLIVTITPPTSAANAFIRRTTFEASSKKVANIAYISYKDENMMRGIDFVTHLVDAYNQRANDEKNEEARKTDEFVNARLAKIDGELGSSDAAWETSKKQFQITQPEFDAQEALTKKSEYEARLVAIGTELQLHDYLSEYINNPANIYEVIPSGISGGASSAADGKGVASAGGGNASLIAQHNSLVNQRRDLLKSVSEMSPQVQRLSESIQELHPTLQLAMKRDRQQLIMQKNVVEREYAHYVGRIGSAPQMERVLTEIGRQREIKQGVYLLMLQKREETAMELANTTDKGKLIDRPAADSTSVQPQKKMVILLALFLGVIIPVVVLYVLRVTKTKIETKQELESATQLPILAELSRVNTDESIRTLRADLLLSLKDGQKIILVASQNLGDGKTFVAKKLTESFSLIGKSCEYINADLRSLNSSNEHPADILASADFTKRILDAKLNNDYVVIDTPELSNYSDAYQVAINADVTLFVVQAGKIQKSDVESLSTNNKLPNLHIIFNV